MLVSSIASSVVPSGNVTGPVLSQKYLHDNVIALPSCKALMDCQTPRTCMDRSAIGKERTQGTDGPVCTLPTPSGAGGCVAAAS